MLTVERGQKRWSVRAVTDQAPDLLDYAAIGISVVSLAIAGTSLGWQIASFMRSGARVTATLREGVLGPGNAFTWPVGEGPSAEHAASLIRDGYRTAVLAVEVTNSGRMSIDVDRVKLRLSFGMELWEPAGTVNPQTPYRLEAHSNKTWYLHGANATSAATAAVKTGIASPPIYARGVVDLGAGKPVTTKERARLM
jgi:hypothetical protein